MGKHYFYNYSSSAGLIMNSYADYAENKSDYP
jgi:hypothetical protein